MPQWTHSFNSGQSNKRSKHPPQPSAGTVVHFSPESAQQRRGEGWQCRGYLCKSLWKEHLSMTVRNHVGSPWELSSWTIWIYNSMEATASLPQRVRRFKGKVPINPYVVCYRGCAVSWNNMGAAGLNAQAMATCTAVCLWPTVTLQTWWCWLLSSRSLKDWICLGWWDIQAQRLGKGTAVTHVLKIAPKIQVEVRPNGKPSKQGNELKNKCNKLLKTQGKMWMLK